MNLFKEPFFSKRFVPFTILLLIGFAFFDILDDFESNTNRVHIYTEILTLCFGFTCLYGIFVSHRRAIQKMSLSLQNQEADLDRLKKENGEWIAKNKTLIEGLSQSIDEQLKKWLLTSAEKEIALLLLKGFSLKEVAEMRNTSEATVRQQSSSIYQKSSVKGRNEFVAFFLEDLLAIQK